MGYSKCLAEMYVQGLSRKVVQENSLTKLFVVRFSDVYPDAPRSLMTVSEACQLILETGKIENALEIAEKTYVNVNIHKKENEDKLKQLI